MGSDLVVLGRSASSPFPSRHRPPPSPPPPPRRLATLSLQRALCSGGGGGLLWRSRRGPLVAEQEGEDGGSAPSGGGGGGGGRWWRLRLFRGSLKVLEPDIQHANNLAAPCLFLFLLQRTDCSLAGALGLLRIPIYKATPPMVKIPYRMVLDVLLESLGLPAAEYRTKACEGGLKCSFNSCAWDLFRLMDLKADAIMHELAKRRFSRSDLWSKLMVFSNIGSIHAEVLAVVAVAGQDGEEPPPPRGGWLLNLSFCFHFAKGDWIKFCTDSPKLCGRPGYAAFNHI
ncbi:hypothetical protein CFC21_041530 [Triticum aestivum]|uniref:Uncharacterized protein n=2 Tax=Triticum aestivum TaxID=4565 RepID=A0A3B6FRJ1_WHEAT|nr:uncharacterized protein LOC123070184 [Triticum aestivum]XP_044349184.1 uncharacterized protein LOC123070184 [Triticum aestivum]KAF7029890.1 hypothetical protein CFC21_041530 [Triticum aestivum]